MATNVWEQIARYIRIKGQQDTLSANDDNRLQMLDQAISYPYSISLGRVSRAKSMRRPKTKISGENPLQHNPNWSQIPDHPNRILIIVGSKSGKTNANKLSLTNKSSKPPNEY